MESISKKIKDLILNIKNTERTIDKLKNLYNNILNSHELNDLEKEALTSEVEKKIRTDFPKSAKKILGGKSEKAKVLLEECLQELIEEFDWTNNKVETKVKVGGDMIGGREHVCWYISYKNLLGLNTGFVYRQITPSQDPYLEVYSRRVGKNKDNNETIKTFRVELKDDAMSEYKKNLEYAINEQI